MYGMLEEGSKPYSAIIIPKIQRDYAQGRPDQELLRNRFLSFLFTAIENPSAPDVVHDFIYGSRDKEGRFYPVDGQQRLTTLFLLGVYLGKRLELSDDEMEFLRKFSYETRDSSKQFCQKLHEISSEHWKGIRKWVEQQWWYNSEWASDPTITSMLTMLEAIDNHFGEAEIEKGVWDRYKRNILFDRINLDELESTDTLYIKMNSRGKALTDFEHFKAELEGYVSKYEVMKSDELSRLIDTTWTDMLWNYRTMDNDFKVSDNDESDYTNNGLDECFYSLFKWYLTVEGLKHDVLEKPSNAPSDIIELAIKILDNKERCTAIINRLVQVMNNLYGIWKKSEYSLETFFEKFILTDWPTWDSDPAKTVIPKDVKVVLTHSWSADLFKLLCKGNPTNEENIYIEAFFEMLDKNIADNLFLDRLRIVRNLTENFRLNPGDFKDAYLKTDEIIATGFNPTSVLKGFNQYQREQEAFKIDWMAHNSHLANQLKFIENHWLFLGNISCIIVGNSIDKVALDRFGSLFNNKADYVLAERLLLCYGDYAPVDNNIKSYAGGARWRWVDIIKSFSNQTTFEVVRQVLNNIAKYDNGKLEEECNDFIKAPSLFTWQYYLVKYSAMRHNDGGTQSKYRYLSGLYTYEMLGANGGGRTERVWNPYNYTIAQLLSNEGVKAVAGEAGDALTMIDRGITAAIREKDILFTYPDGYSFTHPIPQDANGYDTADRIIYSLGACKRVIS